MTMIQTADRESKPRVHRPGTKAAARQQAQAAALITDLGAGRFLVQSASDPTTHYVANLEEGTCTCTAGQYRPTCWHREEARAWREQKQRAAEEAATARLAALVQEHGGARGLLEAFGVNL